MDPTLQLKLRLSDNGDNSDADIRELLSLVVEAGANRADRPVFGDPRPGRRASGPDAADVVATLSSSMPLLTKVITALRSWLAPRPGRTIKIAIDGQTLEINGITEESMDQLVKAWVRKVCEDQ